MLSLKCNIRLCLNLSNFKFVDVSSELSFTVRSKERVVEKSSRCGHMKYSMVGWG